MRGGDGMGCATKSFPPLPLFLFRQLQYRMSAFYEVRVWALCCNVSYLFVMVLYDLMMSFQLQDWGCGCGRAIYNKDYFFLSFSIFWS